MTRLTSVLESCGTPRGDSTYLPSRFSRWLLGMVVGPGARLRRIAKNLGANVASSRILLALLSSKESVCKQSAPS